MSRLSIRRRPLTIRLSPAVLILVVLAALSQPACATNRPPETVVASATADALEVVEKVQVGVIQLNKTGLPEATTRQILDNILKVNDVAKRLSDALQVYHAAASGELLGKVSVLTAEFAGLAGSIFNVEVPQEFVGEVQALAANISQFILTIQLELAKGATQ